MKKLTRNQGIAVAAGLALLTYLFFSGPLINLFTPPTNTSTHTSMNTSENAANASQTQPVSVKDVTVGTGAIAEPGDKVTAHYVGTLTNGQVFDSSRDRGTPISFTLGIGQVIRGWDEGLQGMRVGGKRVLTIAPEYAYGNRAVGTIPANSTLVFEVELVNVEKGQ
jgi:FKBP-type peptidyl-prolyl cis-trans isomerase